MKAPSRELNVIEGELRTALGSETTNIVVIGNLLVEAKDAVGHGMWLPWLRDGFALTDRSARRYMRAATWAAKSDTGVHFANLSPSLLYEISREFCPYTKKDIAAIMELAKSGRVGEDKAEEIYRAKLARETAKERAKDAKQEAKEAVEQASAVAKAAEEAAALLDGPPPVLPPTEEPPPASATAFRPRLQDFDAAVDTLLKLSTKSAAKFLETRHSISELQTAADFLQAVVAEKAELSSSAPPVFRSVASLTGHVHVLPNQRRG